MFRKFTAFNPSLNSASQAKLVRALIAVGTLTMFVLSAGAPNGYGG
jgi:hypothetical protein